MTTTATTTATTTTTTTTTTTHNNHHVFDCTMWSQDIERAAQEDEDVRNERIRVVNK